MKMKEFGPRGGIQGAPLGPPMLGTATDYSKVTSTQVSGGSKVQILSYLYSFW